MPKLSALLWAASAAATEVTAPGTLAACACAAFPQLPNILPAATRCHPLPPPLPQLHESLAQEEARLGLSSSAWALLKAHKRSRCVSALRERGFTAAAAEAAADAGGCKVEQAAATAAAVADWAELAMPQRRAMPVDATR